MPAAASTEKEGCFTNTQRLIQWRDKAVDPPGDARSDLWFIYHLGKRLKELYAGSTAPKDEPLQGSALGLRESRSTRTLAHQGRAG